MAGTEQELRMRCVRHQEKRSLGPIDVEPLQAGSAIAMAGDSNRLNRTEQGSARRNRKGILQIGSENPMHVPSMLIERRMSLVEGREVMSELDSRSRVGWKHLRRMRMNDRTRHTDGNEKNRSNRQPNERFRKERTMTNHIMQMYPKRGRSLIGKRYKRGEIAFLSNLDRENNFLLV